MLLDDQQKEWWKNHTPPEIIEKYGISAATLSRWQKKNNITAKRKSGSGGKSKPPRIASTCKMCGNTHFNKTYCSRECMNEDPDFIQKLKDVDRSYMQTEEYRKTLMKDDVPEYKKYYGKVYRLTEKVYNDNIDTINPNRHTRGLCGVDGAYQLDHITPVRFGFDHGIPPEVIADVNNLQLIPWKDNLLKSNKYEQN